MTTRGLIFVSQMTAGTNPKSLGAWFSSWERNVVSGRGYLVDGRELRAHRAGGVQPAAVAEAARRPLAAAVQRSARRLLPLQRPGGRLVPPELGATLTVAVRRAGLAVQPVVAARPGGQALGDVLGVGGRSALTGAPAGERDGVSAAGGAVAARRQRVFTPTTSGTDPRLEPVRCSSPDSRIRLPLQQMTRSLFW